MSLFANRSPHLNTLLGPYNPNLVKMGKLKIFLAGQLHYGHENRVD